MSSAALGSLMDWEERRQMCSKPPGPHWEAEKPKNWEKETFWRAKKQTVKWQFVSRKLEGVRADFCQQEVRSYQWSSGTTKGSLLTGRYMSRSCSLKEKWMRKAALSGHLHLQKTYVVTQLLQVRNNRYWVVPTVKYEKAHYLFFFFNCSLYWPKNSYLVNCELCKNYLYTSYTQVWSVVASSK